MSLHPLGALSSAPRRVPMLLRACHLEPAVAVTVLVTALAVTAGRGVAGSAAVAAAVLTGQLSVGWCNDAADARRDTACGRRDKPVATGELPPWAAAAAAGTALALCVPLSLLSGAAAGAVHVAGVAAGWAYNLVLKRTVLSPIPYAVGFGSLPAFVTLGLRPSVWPAWWAPAAGALLGVAAHVVNVLPDIDDDLASGVRGLPQRLGPPACRVLAPLVTLAALGVLIAGPPGAAGPADWALGAAAAAVTASGTALPTASGSRWPFRAAIIGSTIAVALLLLRGADMA
ncbi:UbiA family prenyltransferase [Streptomyces sp. ASQP_92]|uniref:UbiA family prenyltransferase n=1 Tax=Streptomyces sp. ASQP_92 TaxID=2979116 RepID=UPI0021BE552B|nr:UbiA family prenyltransferase [Streptomyces sp. ASQP_92]MCT9089899.1 UbiA family prenyltransferase [Streptomyces sp. ASQP_92]